MFNQAQSRSIRARNQAMIRTGGEQGRAAVSSCFVTGATALGLSWRVVSMATATKSAKRFDRPAVLVPPSPRCQAVGILAGNRLVRIPERHVTIGEATAFCEAYNNRLDDNQQAVILLDADVAAIVEQGDVKRTAKGGGR